MVTIRKKSFRREPLQSDVILNGVEAGARDRHVRVCAAGECASGAGTPSGPFACVGDAPRRSVTRAGCALLRMNISARDESLHPRLTPPADLLCAKQGFQSLKPALLKPLPPATSYPEGHPRVRQNCSTLPPASLSGEGLEGRVAAVSARCFSRILANAVALACITTIVQIR